jgi:hypothetical protein
MERPSAPEPLRLEPAPGAVLLDFENLVFGLAHHHGSDHVVEAACIPALCALARELVQPAVRRAYGDWRVRDLNQFQLELYRGGFEIVQVLGRLNPGSRKNASDIRLAVDAVELALQAPHLRRFVIASGDRDMIEIVRCLQKHGREVVVVATDWSASADLSDVCDRFVPYSEIQRRAGLVLQPRVSRSPALDDLRGKLRALLDDERAEPWSAADLQGELAARHGERYSAEVLSAAGFVRLLQLVPDVARVEESPETGALVHAVDAGRAASPGASLPGQAQLVARARLANYRFEGEPERRRRILHALHAAAVGREFSLAEVRAAVTAPEAGLGLRPGDVNKCWTVLYQGRALRPVADETALPMQFRRHVLAPEAATPEQLVRVYERCIVYKLCEQSRDEPTAQDVRVLLGLQEEDLGWCELLLAETRALQRAP